MKLQYNVFFFLSLLFPAASWAVPYVVDLGSANEVIAATRLANGQGLAVGFVNTGGTRQASLFTIAPDGSSFTATAITSPGEQVEVTSISANGQFISGFSLNTFQGLVWSLNDLVSPANVGF